MAATSGSFNYLTPAVRHSLYRNGEVLTRRDIDGSDSGLVGVDLETHVMEIEDARERHGAERLTLERHGFEYSNTPLADPGIDFFSHEPVVRHYYTDCARLVQKATGASHVVAFDHNVRSAGGEAEKRRIRGGQQVQGPAHLVHGDYTLTSGPQRLRDLGSPPTVNDTLRPFLADGETVLPADAVVRAFEPEGRFALINVWRNVAEEPVATHPLALCDARTVDPLDLVVFEIHYEGRIGENYFAKHADGHRWYFFPGLTRDEVLLIKQWDSAGTLARSGGARADADAIDAPSTFSFHSAFEDPSTASDAPDRWSIEVRCAVLY